MFQYPPSSSFSRHLAKPDRVVILASLSSLLGSQVTSREAYSMLNMKKRARDEPLVKMLCTVPDKESLKPGLCSSVGAYTRPTPVAYCVASTRCYNSRRCTAARC